MQKKQDIAKLTHGFRLTRLEEKNRRKETKEPGQRACKVQETLKSISHVMPRSLKLCVTTKVLNRVTDIILVSNKYPYYPAAANTVQTALKYRAISYKYLQSGKPVYRTGRQAHAKLSHCPSFTDKFIDYSSWMTNLLQDVLLCSIAVYFYSLSVI